MKNITLYPPGQQAVMYNDVSAVHLEPSYIRFTTGGKKITTNCPFIMNDDSVPQYGALPPSKRA